MEQAARLPEGTLLARRYAVGAPVDADETGVAYAGYDRRTDHPVTVHEYLPPALSTRGAGELAVMPRDPALGARFFSGSHAFFNAARQYADVVGTAGLFRVRDAFFENGTAYCIADPVPGVTLEAYLRMAAAPLTAGQLMTVLDAVSGGLLVLHSLNRLHGGITAGRILLPERDCDTPLSPMLTGIALPASVLTGADDPLDADAPWRDIHALGETLYLAHTGRAAPEPADEAAFSSLAPPLDQLFFRMLSAEPRIRYDSVFGLLHALGGIEIEREPIPVDASLHAAYRRRLEAQAEAKKLARRRRILRIAMIAAAALVAIAAVIWILPLR